MYQNFDFKAERIFRMLTEYCSVMEEYNYSYEENLILDIEYRIAEAIVESFPSALLPFQEIGYAIHRAMDAGELLDPRDFEDDFIRLYNFILRMRDKRNSFNADRRAEHPIEIGSLSRYNPSLNQFCRFDEEYDDIDAEGRNKRNLEFKTAVRDTLQYLRNSTKPVQRATLMTEIKNCSSSVISHACTHRDILNYLGSYYCGANIVLSQDVKQSFKKSISRILDDNEIHHADELYNKLKDTEHIVFSETYVHSSFQLLSLLRYLYGSEFTISRPFISLKDVHIPTIPERVIRFIGKRKEIQIADIVEFFRDKNIIIPRLLSLLDAINRHVLIKDHTTLVATDSLGLTPVILKEIETAVSEELDDVNCKAVRELLCFPKLPRIAIPWTEWLLYSVIRKNIPTVRTYTTSPQFRHGIPVLSLSEELTNEELAEISERHQGSIHTTVTMDTDDFEEELDDDILLEFDWEDNDEL